MHDPKSGNRQPSNTKHGLLYCLMGKTYNYIDIPIYFTWLHIVIQFILPE